MNKRTIENLAKKIWGKKQSILSSDYILIDFEDKQKSKERGYGCSESHGCHDLESFLRVIAEAEKRDIHEMKLRICHYEPPLELSEEEVQKRIKKYC